MFTRIKDRIELALLNAKHDSGGFLFWFRYHLISVAASIVYAVIMIFSIVGAFTAFPLHKPSITKYAVGMHIVPLFSWMRWRFTVTLFIVATPWLIALFLFDNALKYDYGSPQRRSRFWAGHAIIIAWLIAVTIFGAFAK